MNLSFVLLGVTTIVGALTILEKERHRTLGNVGRWSMVASGVGTILVGLFPENTVYGLHLGGAALVFVGGNLAMIILGVARGLPRYIRLYSVAGGVVGIIALLIFLANQGVGIGVGGFERVTAYPQTLWLIVVGLSHLIHPPDEQLAQSSTRR